MSEITSYRAILKKGETLDISGLASVHFEAATFHKVSNGVLTAGDYKVGQDIKPGRYKISLVSGSGNISTNSGSVNEIFSSDASYGGVTSTTANLHKGQVLSFDVQSISLKKK